MRIVFLMLAVIEPVWNVCAASGYLARMFILSPSNYRYARPHYARPYYRYAGLYNYRYARPYTVGRYYNYAPGDYQPHDPYYGTPFENVAPLVAGIRGIRTAGRFGTELRRTSRVADVMCHLVASALCACRVDRNAMDRIVAALHFMNDGRELRSASLPF
jgi:hypothetical protein